MIDLKRFDELWGSITKHYASPGLEEPPLPLHLVKPDASIFWISTYADFKKMSHFQSKTLCERGKSLLLLACPLMAVLSTKTG
jgi:hypothetical protein